VAQIEHFRRLFRRIRSHGYRRSKPITVSIDHDGSVTIYDGHHRAAIAVFLNMSIPAKVRWRHPAWIAQVSTPKSDLLAPAAGSRPR
jgi:hypothetical protein